MLDLICLKRASYDHEVADAKERITAEKKEEEKEEVGQIRRVVEGGHEDDLSSRFKNHFKQHWDNSQARKVGWGKGEEEEER